MPRAGLGRVLGGAPLLLALMLMLPACSSSDTDDATGDQFAVRLVNTSNGDMSFNSGVNWCYDGESCSPASISGGGVVFAGQSMISTVSQAGENLTAVSVRYEIQSGSGRLEIMQGSTGGSDWSSDFTGQVVHSVGAEAGETIAFTWSP